MISPSRSPHRMPPSTPALRVQWTLLVGLQLPRPSLTRRNRAICCPRRRGRLPRRTPGRPRSIRSHRRGAACLGEELGKTAVTAVTPSAAGRRPRRRSARFRSQTLYIPRKSAISPSATTTTPESGHPGPRHRAGDGSDAMTAPVGNPELGRRSATRGTADTIRARPCCRSRCWPPRGMLSPESTAASSSINSFRRTHSERVRRPLSLLITGYRVL